MDPSNDTLTFDKRITLRIDPEVEDALKRAAKRLRKKPGEVGREALVEHLKKLGELEPAVAMNGKNGSSGNNGAGEKGGQA